MVNLSDRSVLAQIVAGIVDQSEVTRRAEAYRRHLIYRDGGKRFLLEQIRREFDEAAVSEMRLCPINLLKKIVNKRASVYRRAPIRTVSDDNTADQMLVDHYVKAMELNKAMQKANRYYILHSNAALYTKPTGQGKLCLEVIPPYMYSLIPDPIDRSEVDTHVFSAFTERGRAFSSVDQLPATGRQGFSREPGYASGKPMVDSEQLPATDADRQFVLWSSEYNVTLDGRGAPIEVEGEHAVPHLLGMSPVVNLARDRDNEAWAIDGEDMIDLTMAIQSGWTDLLTIAKQQGFSILTIIGEDRPEKMTLGVNKAVWLKARENGPRPELKYTAGQANLGEYRQLLMELLGLLLSTNDMNPKSIGGAGGASNVTSGFHALIEMADTLEAVEADKPTMLDAELAVWQRIKAWHNQYHDAAKLDPKAQALGKFSDEFELNIIYQDIKPIESEQDRLSAVKDMRGLSLITRKKAILKLNPDMTAEQAEQELEEIDSETQARVAAFDPPKAEEIEEDSKGLPLKIDLDG